MTLSEEDLKEVIDAVNERYRNSDSASHLMEQLNIDPELAVAAVTSVLHSRTELVLGFLPVCDPADAALCAYIIGMQMGRLSVLPEPTSGE